MSVINDLANRINKLESLLGGEYGNQKISRTNEQDGGKKLKQNAAAFGIYTALCVSTRDYMAQNRIQIWCPLFHSTDIDIQGLPWAFPISALGGFDDSGLSWVPPAGSTVMFAFEGGNRSVPYYLGTTWSRTRSGFGVSVPEFDQIYAGRRGGYLVGNPNQVLPPWNTESYNVYDFGGSRESFEATRVQQPTDSYPNIYGFKTPEKHMIKMVDGSTRCARKWKRFEIMSGCGNWMIMKDDHLHHGGEWANPACNGIRSSTDCYEDYEVNTKAKVCRRSGAGNDVNIVNAANSGVLGISSSSVAPNKKTLGGANRYFKQASECRPYSGPRTPQNNRCDLPQTGIQLLSISGHTMVMDDSVEAPSGLIRWERSMQPFDFGCTNRYMGKIYFKSCTGHVIEMNDTEKPTGRLGSPAKVHIRGEDNGVKLKSALGNQIFLCDDTEVVLSANTSINSAFSGGYGKRVATAKQGISITSTSLHEIVLSDGGNDRELRERRDGSVPVAKATKGFLRIRSGYGLMLLFSDTDSQEKTAQQRITLMAPQKTNLDKKGPHYLIMQEKASGPGQVILRAGGALILAATDSINQVIGSKDNPANQVTSVSKNSYYIVKNMQYQQNERFMNVSDDRAYILAGKDYEQKKDPGSTKPKEKAPGVFPVVVFAEGKLKISDRVYASCSKSAATASIYNLRPNIGVGEKGVLKVK